MAIFLTGATGYIGSYVAAGLLRGHRDRLIVLVRAKGEHDARKRLWQAWQLHMDFAEFQALQSRVDVALGDLTSPDLGLHGEARDRVVRATDSVLHVAASLNRKSAKACFNVNLRGTLSVIKLAQQARDHHGLRRFSDVSTVAVAGTRQDEVVTEDGTIDWERSDYDPYARTKKFCEHMLHELLPDVPKVVFRPSTIMGDSRFPQTTQFDMVRAFAIFAHMRALPFKPEWRMDICPADYVGDAIVHVHQAERPRWDAYNLSAGLASPTYREILTALKRDGHRPAAVFVPVLRRPFTATVDGLVASPRGLGLSLPASLMKVFLPYLTYNTVFENSRIVAELGRAPAPFTSYAYGLLRFAVDGGFRYPHLPWPEGATPEAAQ
jgi:thioester reductase-like protein